jgi:hypothetical protein
MAQKQPQRHRQAVACTQLSGIRSTRRMNVRWSRKKTLLNKPYEVFCDPPFSQNTFFWLQTFGLFVFR